MRYNLPLNPLFLTAEDWQLYYPKDTNKPNMTGLQRAATVKFLNTFLAHAIQHCPTWYTFLRTMREAQYASRHWGAGDSEGRQIVDAYSRHYYRKETRYLD